MITDILLFSFQSVWKHIAEITIAITIFLLILKIINYIQHRHSHKTQRTIEKNYRTVDKLLGFKSDMLVDTNAVYLTRFKLDHVGLYLVHLIYGCYLYYSDLINLFCLCIAAGQIVMYGEYRTLVPLSTFTLISTLGYLYITYSNIKEQIHINGTRVASLRYDNGVFTERRDRMKNLKRGDFVELYPGDQVPADILLIGHQTHNVSELAMTGESVILSKQGIPKGIEALEDAVIVVNHHKNNGHITLCNSDILHYTADNMLFRGTTPYITTQAYGMIIETGNDCQIYRLNYDMNKRPTGLHRQITEMCTFNLKILAMLSITIGFILYEQSSGQTSLIKNAVSVILLGNTLIPLSLQFFSNLACIIITKRISKELNVRFNTGGLQSFQHNPVHVVTDKTGTLTTGQLSLDGIYGLNGHLIDTELRVDMSVCLEGDPMEEKVKDLLQCINIPHVQHKRRFNRDIGCKLAIIKITSDTYKLHLQGIPETLIHYCGAGTEKLDMIYNRKVPQDTYIRVIAYCNGIITEDIFNAIVNGKFTHITEGGLLTNLHFYVFYDHLVPGLKHAINQVHGLCDTVTLLTGDSIVSAKAVASSVGMNTSCFISGQDFERESQSFSESLDERIRDAKDIVIYRASPHVKQLYVSYMQRNNASVMMVGDGPNDVSAIMQSDVGVGVVGESATVQRVSDVVIDNWTKIPQLLQAFWSKQHIIYNVIQWVMLKHILTGCTLLSMLLVSFYENIKDPVGPYIMAIFNGATCLVMALYTYTENPVTHSFYPYRLMSKGCFAGFLLGIWIYVTDAEAVYMTITTQFCILMVKLYLMTDRPYYLLINVVILSFVLLADEPFVYLITAAAGCVSYYIID